LYSKFQKELISELEEDPKFESMSKYDGKLDIIHVKVFNLGPSNE